MGTWGHGVLRVCSDVSRPVFTWWYPCCDFSHSHATPDKERECLCRRIQNNRQKGTKMCNDFCQNIGENCTETYDMIKIPFEEDSTDRTLVLEWFRCFK